MVTDIVVGLSHRRKRARWIHLLLIVLLVAIPAALFAGFLGWASQWAASGPERRAEQVEQLRNADPAADALAALRNGDARFLGIKPPDGWDRRSSNNPIDQLEGQSSRNTPAASAGTHWQNDLPVLDDLWFPGLEADQLSAVRDLGHEKFPPLPPQSTMQATTNPDHGEALRKNYVRRYNSHLIELLNNRKRNARQ